MQHLLRKGLGSPHVDRRGPARRRRRGALARALARVDLSARVSDIDHADAILVLDTELVDEAPILDLRVRKAVRRNGARLVVASSRPSTLDARRLGRAALRARRRRGGARQRSPRRSAPPRAAARRSTSSRERAGATTGFIPGRTADERRRGAARARESDAVRAAADVLRDAGDVVVIWGERVARRRARRAGRRGAARGRRRARRRRQAGVRPDRDPRRDQRARAARGGLRRRRSGPGLADADAAGDPDAARGALLLFEADAPEPELARAGAVIAFAHFPPRRSRSRPTWSSPPRSTPEKEGTSPTPTAASSACARRSAAPGEVRPGWSVLAELCERLGAGTGALSSADGHRADRRGRALLRRPHARRDRRRRRALAGPRRARPRSRAPSCRASRSSSRRRRTDGLMLGAGAHPLDGPGGRALALAALPRHRPARAALGRRTRASSASRAATRSSSHADGDSVSAARSSAPACRPAASSSRRPRWPRARWRSGPARRWPADGHRPREHLGPDRRSRS